MNIARTLAAATVAVVLSSSVSTILSFQASTRSVVGVWVLNKESSDTENLATEGARGRGPRGSPPAGRGRAGRGGTFGRGGRGRGDREDVRRQRDAVREILEAPERLTIVQTESMVIITTGEGRTTRLSTDGSKVKDESTGIEWKTRWEADRLVTEISGAGPRKIIQTYAVNPETHQLLVTVQTDSDNNSATTTRRIYDAMP